jgi:hypothetical protein
MQKIILILILLKYTGLYSIKPVKPYLQTPIDYGLNYKDTLLKTIDGSNISVWIISQDSSKGTYMLAYGDAGNKSYLLYQAYCFYTQGYNIVLFDYRGFGGSSDFKHQENFLYHSEYFEDFKTVYHFSKSLTNKLRIYAISMGTIFASRIPSDSNDIHIYDSPVLDCKFAKKMLKKEKSINLKCPIISKINVHENIIIIYGKNDFLVKESDIILFCKNGNFLVYYNNFGHLEALNFMGSKYFELINSF